MQKLLITLTTIFFSNSTIASIIPPTASQTKILAQTAQPQEEKKEVFLDVPSVLQNGADYCVAASLVSIFKFWGWIENKSQEEIFHEARLVSQTPASESGIRVNNNTAIYMNDFIHQTTNQEATYGFSGIDITFGISLDDIEIFSTYVWNSLSINIPLIVGMFPSPGLGHALVLCGYEESLDNHWYDEYGMMDPADGQIYWIMAQDLHQSFKHGFTLIGHDKMPSIKDALQIEITPFDKELRDLPGNNIPAFAGEVQLNITKHTGISNFSYFNVAFDILSLPDFKSEIKKVNDDPDLMSSFGLNTAIFPNTDIDQWGSQNTIFHSFGETIGCETIKTWTSIQLLISRIQNNELMLYLRFYGGWQVTRDSNFTPTAVNYELTGRQKISSGPTIILRRNLQPHKVTC
ncbi:papain like cysteine protease AvrRpt2 [Entomoplasma freundtii]|uniref:Uncharacterized protein n=1 Tax=Entomoplasma freundtii TaxID=74700 RepID=A0A2K8NTR8_9MOLU|nr:papain-like cysteine protease family protein [Entomoplasma freundtii]ATZ16151.1 hypothetical protein EFREU_v1c01240 [Entomoplasma freundtii]TDY56948.1 papain like cysteine protease AvrRpt2 [Entomoplasma freundtii]